MIQINNLIWVDKVENTDRTHSSNHKIKIFPRFVGSAPFAFITSSNTLLLCSILSLLSMLHFLTNYTIIESTCFLQSIFLRN